MNNPVTCGIFLMVGDKLLICHPTGAPKNVWSIPKGLKDGGEGRYTAAERELKEETGIDLELYKNNIVNRDTFGLIRYKNGKKSLKAFLVVLNKIPDVELKCESLIDGSDKPEVDRFAWVTLDESLELLHETQKEIIKIIQNER